MYINNNNKNKKKDKNEKGKVKKGEGHISAERVRRRRDLIIFSLPFASFSDLRELDRRFLLEQEAKLVYATRAMRGHQNLSVSSKSTREGIFLLVLFLA